MAAKKLMCILFGILVISTWVLEARAETMNYKFYSWVIKRESTPMADVAGHRVVHDKRGAFYVFENGEVATVNHVTATDLLYFEGTLTQDTTINFPDGSTITMKGQGTVSGWRGQVTSEIIKGTGRFDGIKGTQAVKYKLVEAEEGEAGPPSYGEGTITYTLPSK